MNSTIYILRMNIMSVLQKLFEIQKMNLSIKKDWINPHFRNEYITLDKLVSVLQPICNDIWLLIYHTTADWEVITTVRDISGDELDDVCSYFPLWDISNPQKVWSAITYAKRYNLCQIFNIITDRDDDANVASIKPPFTQSDFKKLFESKVKFIDADTAIASISKKRTLSNEDKEHISSLYD